MQPLVREVTDYVEFVGHIVAAREAELRARASGTVIAVYCRPGQVVKLDERLFKIDPRLYKAALDQAEAELERVRARRTLAQNELANTKTANARQASGQPEEVKLFEVELLEADAAVKVAEAARDVSRLNLEFTEVTAPFAGRVSGPVLGQGNVAVADTTRLATIVSTDRVCVTFNVPEKISLRFRRLRSERCESKGEGGSGRRVGLADETDYPHRGKIDSIEVGIDTATGAARWSAFNSQSRWPALARHVRPGADGHERTTQGHPGAGRGRIDGRRSEERVRRDRSGYRPETPGKNRSRSMMACGRWKISRRTNGSSSKA